MQTLQKIKSFINTKTLALGATLAAATTVVAPEVYAEPAIANDTLEGLPSVGEDLGGFLSNLAPGLGTFILIVAIFVGIGAIVAGIAVLITTLAKKMKWG